MDAQIRNPIPFVPAVLGLLALAVGLQAVVSVVAIVRKRGPLTEQTDIIDWLFGPPAVPNPSTPSHPSSWLGETGRMVRSVAWGVGVMALLFGLQVVAALRRGESITLRSWGGPLANALLPFWVASGAAVALRRWASTKALTRSLGVGLVTTVFVAPCGALTYGDSLRGVGHPSGGLLAMSLLVGAVVWTRELGHARGLPRSERSRVDL